jgi:tetratricopeptide (TPR) repeat protein
VRQNIRALEPELLRSGDGAAYRVYSRCYLAHCLAELGEFSEGVAYSTEALQMAEGAERTYPLVHACFVSGVVTVRQGDLARAVSVLERGLALCRGREFPVLDAVTRAVLGYAYALSGRVAEALPYLEAAVDALAHSMRGSALAMAYLGEAYLVAGRREDARAVADRALALTVERKERGNQGWALRLRGEIAAHAEPVDVDGAETSYRAAIALATELGMSPLRAQCHLGLGRCYRCRGWSAQARVELGAASALFRAMQSPWLPRAEAELQPGRRG